MKALTESWKTLKLMKSLSDFKKNSSDPDSMARDQLIKSFETKNGLQYKIAQYFDLNHSVEGLGLRDFALIPIDEVKAILTSEWGEGKTQEFEIDWDVVKSASMGQVHFAIHRPSNREVIIKVLFPEIKQTIVDQIKGLEFASFIPSAFMSKKYKLQMSDYLEKLKQVLSRECDLTNESQARETLSELMKECEWIIVPEVMEDYTTANVLVQEYDSGMDFESFVVDSSPEVQKDLGEKIISTFFYQVFSTGFLQGDTNKGNFLFHPSVGDSKITLIDYGNYFQLSDDFRSNLFSLIYSVCTNEDVDPLPYFSGMGFDSTKLKHFHQTLPLLVQKLFAPFLSSIPFDLNRWKLSRDIDIVLGEHKWWFRSAGGLEFFQMMKSVKGMFGMLQRLDVNFNWKQIFLESTKGLERQLFLKHQIESDGFKVNALAKNLVIHITEKGSDKVNLSLPSAALMNLRDLMEPSLISNLESKGVDVDFVIRKAIRKGGYPGTLFQFQDGEKSIEISLK